MKFQGQHFYQIGHSLLLNNMIDIIPYTQDKFDDWDSFILKSRAANFLYMRDYLEHHKTKFQDSSIFLTRKDKIVGIFPAAIIERKVISHPGITYGGLVISKEMHASDTLTAFDKIIDFYSKRGVDELIYKVKPQIYSDYSSQSDIYALFLLKAKMFRRDLSSVVNMEDKIKLSKGKIWSINKSKKNGVSKIKSLDIKPFYEMLKQNLEKYSAHPTHSMSELEDLLRKFPENISLYVAVLDGKVIAGTVVYDFGKTIHTQYLASTEDGRILGALDHTIHFLQTVIYAEKKYFSFGISTECDGTILNKGLLGYKESFGSTGLTHDFYSINLN